MTTVFIGGFMATGKSTVGRLLAPLVQRPFCDLDMLVEESAGSSVAAIFSGEGETTFRAREARALASVAESGAVVALGGGTLLDESNRTLVKRTGRLVILTAAVEEIARRIAADTSHVARPLLGAAPAIDRESIATVAATLIAKRQAAYAGADLQVDTTGRSAHDVAQEVAAWIACA